MLARNFESFAARVCGIRPIPVKTQPVMDCALVPVDTFCRDLVERIASVPKTPLDFAAETLEALVPGHDRTWYRQEAMWIVGADRADRSAVERQVIARYREAQSLMRAGE